MISFSERVLASDSMLGSLSIQHFAVTDYMFVHLPSMAVFNGFFFCTSIGIGKL